MRRALEYAGGLGRHAGPALRGRGPLRGRPHARGRVVLPPGHPRRARRGRGADGRSATSPWPASPAPACTSSTCPPPGRSSWCGRPRPRGLPVTAEATPHHLTLTARRGGRLRPGVQGEPAAAAPTPTWPRSGPVWPTARSTPSPPTTRPTPRRSRSTPSTRRRAACSVSRRRSAVALTEPRRRHGPRRHRRRAVVAPGGHRRPDRRARRPDRGRPPANLCVFDPAERWMVDPARSASRSRNTPYAGRELTGRVRHTVCRDRSSSTARPRAVDRSADGASVMTRREGRDDEAVLVLADGTRVRGRGHRRRPAGRCQRRRGRLQHRPDRLPGDHHRPVLRRADHHLHLSPHRQLRHDAADDEAGRAHCRGIVVRELARRRSNWRSDERPRRVPAGPRPGRHRRRRHPPAHPPPPRRRRHARCLRHRATRPRSSRPRSTSRAPTASTSSPQ